MAADRITATREVAPIFQATTERRESRMGQSRLSTLAPSVKHREWRASPSAPRAWRPWFPPPRPALLPPAGGSAVARPPRGGGGRGAPSPAPRHLAGRAPPA